MNPAERLQYIEDGLGTPPEQWDRLAAVAGVHRAVDEILRLERRRQLNRPGEEGPRPRRNAEHQLPLSDYH